MTRTHKRVIIATTLGLFFGLLCAWMATIRRPVEPTIYNLAAAIYVRTSAGFFIGLLSNAKIVRWKYINAMLRGMLIGFAFSVPLALPQGLMAVAGFGLFGAIYGIITDVIVTKLCE